MNCSSLFGLEAFRLRRITDVLNQFKQDWMVQLDEQGIADACIDSGMTWIESLLNPITTVQIFFLQVLHGNTRHGKGSGLFCLNQHSIMLIECHERSDTVLPVKFFMS